MNFYKVVILFCCLCAACTDNDWKDEAESLNQELATQKSAIEAIQNHALVTNIVRHEYSYDITFSTGQTLTLATDQTPLMQLGDNGHWFINGEDSGSSALASGGTLASKVPVLTGVVDHYVCTTFLFSDGSELIIDRDLSTLAPDFRNNPFPYHADTLRVLAIGNSFAEDGLALLHHLTQASGIDEKRLSVYAANRMGWSMDQWVELIEAGDTVNLSRMAGQLRMRTQGTLKDLLRQPWDIVTVQQLSSKSHDYATYNPALRRLVRHIRENCPNQRVMLAFHQTWSYWEDAEKEPKGTAGYEAIVRAVKQEIALNGIDYIIPTGTAIQNARRTSLNTPHDLTCDGRHLAYGTARYIAACTWFQAIIAPAFNVGVLGNTATYACTEAEKASSLYETADVTEQNRELCQRCAFLATINRFSVSDAE